MKMYLKYGMGLLMILFFFPAFLSAQKSKSEKQVANEKAIKEMIEGKSYVFVANSVSPMRGSMQMLTTTYDLRVSGDSVISDLPYFGRAFQAPIGTASAGIGFTSIKNAYTITETAKGSWQISIKPDQQQTDVNKLNLTVFTNGSASLTVTSNNRDPISFRGDILVKK